MHITKEFGASLEEDNMGMACVNCSSHRCSTNNRQRPWRSVFGVYDDVLNISPRLSYHNPTICLERRLHDRSSLRFPAKASERSFTSSYSSDEISLPKLYQVPNLDMCDIQPAAELVEEIATLELEVVHLERYLLSLYRTAFDQYLTRSPTVNGRASTVTSASEAGSLVRDAQIQLIHQATHAVDASHQDDKMNQSHSIEEMEKSTLSYKHTENSRSHSSETCLNSCHPSPRESPKNNISRTVSGHHSLADHLGASINDHVPDSHYKLSEDIVRCISAIYCKLANPPTQQIDLLPSPNSSLSSSSTFSPQDHGDNWSPQCHYEGAASPCQFVSLKSKLSPYSSMVEIPKIRVDGDRFDYASKMLSNFRCLIRRLQTIDPRKMGHEEQLAFWINIHNALVMHAFLAYGLRQNHMKSTSSNLKAVYNVGGYSVNAYAIQSSILGCQLHRPALVTLRTLITPAIKFMTGNAKNPYALDRPEPLTHFALCLGAHSDPALRVYTAKGIYEELNIAKSEFIQANVSVQRKTRIILPKILYYYAKDAALELSNLMEMVCECIAESQREVIRGCIGKKLSKCVEWSPYKSAFRYLVHRDLAK